MWLQLEVVLVLQSRWLGLTLLRHPLCALLVLRLSFDRRLSLHALLGGLGLAVLFVVLLFELLQQPLLDVAEVAVLQSCELLKLGWPHWRDVALLTGC